MKTKQIPVATSDRDKAQLPLPLTCNWRRIFFSFLFAFGLAGTPALAQVDVTATGGTANASYATVGAAFTAINAGTHTGTITIGISANTNEAASAALNASGT